MALLIAPPASHSQQTHLPSSAPSLPGVHDTLRANLNLSIPTSSSPSQQTMTAAATSFHPLESRLARWRETQTNLKMEMLRRQFGIAEPIKRSMELSIVRAGEWRPAALGGGGILGSTASLHADILEGRDSEFGWEDVFVGGEELRGGMDFHVEMEGRAGMGAW